MQSSLALTFTLDWASDYLLIVLVSSTVHLLEVAEAAQLLLQEQHMNLLNRPKSIHIAKKKRFTMTTGLMKRCFLGQVDEQSK